MIPQSSGKLKTGYKIKLYLDRISYKMFKNIDDNNINGKYIKMNTKFMYGLLIRFSKIIRSCNIYNDC